MENIDNYQRIILEIEDYAILLLDKSGVIMDWNKGAEKLKGYLSEEIVGKNFRIFYTKQDQDSKLPEKLIKKAILNGKAIDEGWRVRKDGSCFWGSILINSLYDDDNKLTGFIKITRDLTERKTHEDKLTLINESLELQVNERSEKLLSSEKKYRYTLDNMLEGIQMHDFSWRYIYVNDALVSYSKYTREELVGYSLMEKYPGIEQTDLFATLQRCMIDRVPEQIETDFIFPDGTLAYFDLSIQPIPEGLFILSVDRTEQKKAKDKLVKVNRLYNFNSSINKSIVHISNEKELLDNACTIASEVGLFKIAYIGMIDENNKLNIVSLTGENGANRILKQSGFDYKDPVFKDVPTVKVIKTGKYALNNDMQNDPLLSHWKDEFIQQGIFSSISLPIFKLGKVVGVFGLHAGRKDFFDKEEIALLEEATDDISFAIEIFEKTKRHNEVAELLLKNEKRFRALIENSTDMKTLTNGNGEFIYASPSVSKVFEYSPEEFLHQPVFKFFHPDDLPDLIKNREDILKTPGKSFYFQYRLLHKKGHWIWCEGSLTNMFHEPAINALVSNFRDISEKKIADKQKEFDQNNLNALINNTKDLLWSVDREFKLITFNKPFFEIIKLVSGKDLVKGDDVFSVVLSPEQFHRFKIFYNRAFSGEAFTELEYIEKPVESWSEISFYPIKTGDEVIGTACHSRDITDRKKAEYEREKMIADIIQRNKSFEQFAYIVSHNLRAPVANILGISQVLETDLSDSDRLKTQEFLFKAVEHLDEIVRDLNLILQTRTEITENKKTIYFQELVNEIKLSIQNLINKQNAKILTDFSIIDNVVILKSYIYSIFYNLILNSIKFRRPDIEPIIQIKTYIHHKKLRISFKDNGRGIDLRQYETKLFGLYKRFHLDVEGKGLGLFMVKTQLEVLNGSIQVKSDLDTGTEFIIELPI